MQSAKNNVGKLKIRPNRGVDHRQLRFELQLRSGQEVATQQCGSSPGLSSSTSPRRPLFYFISLFFFHLRAGAASLRAAALRSAFRSFAAPTSASGRLLLIARSDPRDRRPVSGHGRTNKKRGLLPIEWVIFRNLDVMAVFDDDTLADR
jgi:hypothetical protein